MDREQEDMQFLGLFGIYLESYKIIFTFRKIFTKITLSLILPLCFIYLAHIEASQFIFHKIVRTENQLENTRETKTSAKLSDRLFSLLSTAAVVFTVASIYTARDITLRKVMSIVPRVWKRLMDTFMSVVFVFFLYNVAASLFIIEWGLTGEDVNILSIVLRGVLILIGIFCFGGFVYMTVVWQLASVVSVLEDLKGDEAMTKSTNLIKGKMWIVVLIFVTLNLALTGIQKLFEKFVVRRGPLGVAGRLGFGFLCFLMLFKVFLFGLVIQTVFPLQNVPRVEPFRPG